MKWPGVSLALLVTSITAGVLAQTTPSVPPRPLPDQPFVVDSAEHRQIRVSALKGLSHPWSLTFLPGGEMLGGDEVNILKPGANYGWPLVTCGRQYSGAKVSGQSSREGFVDPELISVPSIAVSGMTFYTGDRFPGWKNNLFAGGLQFGGIRGTGQMHRIVFNEKWEEISTCCWMSMPTAISTS